MESMWLGCGFEVRQKQGHVSYELFSMSNVTFVCVSEKVAETTVEVFWENNSACLFVCLDNLVLSTRQMMWFGQRKESRKLTFRKG